MLMKTFCLLQRQLIWTVYFLVKLFCYSTHRIKNLMYNALLPFTRAKKFRPVVFLDPMLSLIALGVSNRHYAFERNRKSGRTFFFTNKLKTGYSEYIRIRQKDRHNDLKVYRRVDLRSTVLRQPFCAASPKKIPSPNTETAFRGL